MTTSSEDILVGLLAECSDSILAGVTVSACLDRHPQHAAALEPLLIALSEVYELRAAPMRSAAAAARTRDQFMTAARRLSAEPRRAPAAWWAGFVALFVPPAGSRSLRGSMPRSMPVGLFATMIIVILAGVLVTGGVTVSARSLPGDFLYPIKTTTERVQLLVTRAPAARNLLEQQFSGRRLQEAKAVAERGRRVPSLPLDGLIESISGDHWTVSGLTLTLAPDVQIIGTPTVGARARGILRAPGDGRLIVIYVEVEEPTAGDAPVAAASQPLATPTRAAPTATATPTAAAMADDSISNLPPQRWSEPDDWTPAAATATPTVTRLSTATRTPGLTGTPTLTRAPTSTLRPDLPAGKEQVPQRIEGWVQRIEGSQWIIAGTAVNTNGGTQIIGNPGVGWKVSALVVLEADSSLTALQIAAIAAPEATPEPVEFTDILQEMDGEWWTIGSTRVRIRGDTAIEDDPQIGDLVSVKGERHRSEIWALRVFVITLTEVQFEGIVSAVSGSSLIVGGNTVLIDSQTQLIGTPEVGRVAQVAAVRMPDGRLIGKVIIVLDPTPTPTVTATQQPTPTSTLEPMPSPTPEPTSTDTPELTPSPTPEPTSTDTPELTPSPTPEPTSTDTPEAAPSPTLEPTPTDTPEATASPSPVP